MQVGFEAVDSLAAEHGLSWDRKLNHKAVTAQGHIHGQRVVLCKPMTFMNVSGESVRPLAQKHGFARGQVWALLRSACMPRMRCAYPAQVRAGSHASGVRQSIGTLILTMHVQPPLQCE